MRNSSRPPKPAQPRSLATPRLPLRASLLALGAALAAACGDDGKTCELGPYDGSTDPVHGDDGGTGPSDDAGLDGGAPALDAAVPGDDGSVPDAGPLGDAGWPIAPALHNPVAMLDVPLAKKALGIMGSAAVGAEGSCRSCHAISRPTLSKWRFLTDNIDQGCLRNPSLSDQESVDSMFECINEMSEDFGAPITQTRPAQLGIYAAAAHLGWFEFAFEHASSTQPGWKEQHKKFIGSAGMPRAGEKLSQESFDVVAEWFARGLPKLRELVPLQPGNMTCTPKIDDALKAHVAKMKTAGWRAYHHQNALPMFGCAPGGAALGCLADLPLAKSQPYGSSWDVLANSRMRILHDNSATPSTYWSRSSADGRYISSAVYSKEEEAGGAQIVDLQRKVRIDVSAGVDPGYFPDNSGFVFQGGAEGALVCDQTVLAGNPAHIKGDEAQCGMFGEDLIGIYEQLGKSVGGSDYWVAAGIFESDDGGFYPTLNNPYAPFDAESEVTLTPMLNEGHTFKAGTPTQLKTPQEGDPVLSPSGTLLLTRAKGEELEVDEFGTVVAVQNGYRIYGVSTQQGAEGLSAKLEPLATLCMEGGKPMISFDERWMVIHHYITDLDAKELGFSDANAPGFADYRELGGSNLYLVDLLTGKSTRLTSVKPGQYALYPHFRADNWIYFVVRTTEGKAAPDGGNHEYFVASDAALLLEASDH